MRAKRIVAVVVLVVIAFLIVFPPLSSGGVRITSSSSTSVPAEHLYVTVGEISAHRADTREPSGWFSITNKSSIIDLALNASETIALGSLPLGEYDIVRVTVTNATVMVNGTSRTVQLESRVFTIPVSFLVRFGVQTPIMLKIAPELQGAPDAATLRLSFTAVTS